MSYKARATACFAATAMLVLVLASNATDLSRRSYIIKVQAADGAPLSNVAVAVVDPKTTLSLNRDALVGGGQRFQTDAQGRFSLPPGNTNVFIVVAVSNGFGA